LDFSILRTSPIEKNKAVNDEPPYEINGRGIPVSGIMAAIAPMFIKD